MNDLVPDRMLSQAGPSPLNAGMSEVSPGLLVAIAERLVFARLRVRSPMEP